MLPLRRQVATAAKNGPWSGQGNAPMLRGVDGGRKIKVERKERRQRSNGAGNDARFFPPPPFCAAGGSQGLLQWATQNEPVRTPLGHSNAASKPALPGGVWAVVIAGQTVLSFVRVESEFYVELHPTPAGKQGHHLKRRSDTGPSVRQEQQAGDIKENRLAGAMRLVVNNPLGCALIVDCELRERVGRVDSDCSGGQRESKGSPVSRDALSRWLRVRPPVNLVQGLLSGSLNVSPSARF